MKIFFSECPAIKFYIFFLRKLKTNYNTFRLFVVTNVYEMDRKSFLKQGILGTGVFVASSISAKLLVNDIDELKQKLGKVIVISLVVHVFKHMILFVVTDKFDLLAMGAVVLMLA